MGRWCPPMSAVYPRLVAARTVADAAGMLVADVIHGRSPALPVTASVGDVRAWFAASTHRRLAVLSENNRYAGCLTRDDVAGELDADVPAVRVAHEGPTVAPDAPAQVGHQLAASTQALRVPVVDDAGHLVGVLAVTEDLTAFCGTG